MIKSLTQELLQKAQVLENSRRVSKSRQKSAKWEFSKNLRICVFLLMQAVPLDPSLHSDAMQRSWIGY